MKEKDLLIFALVGVGLFLVYRATQAMTVPSSGGGGVAGDMGSGDMGGVSGETSLGSASVDITRPLEVTNTPFNDAQLNSPVSVPAATNRVAAPNLPALQGRGNLYFPDGTIPEGATTWTEVAFGRQPYTPPVAIPTHPPMSLAPIPGAPVVVSPNDQPPPQPGNAGRPVDVATRPFVENPSIKRGKIGVMKR